MGRVYVVVSHLKLPVNQRPVFNAIANTARKTQAHLLSLYVPGRLDLELFAFLTFHSIVCKVPQGPNSDETGPRPAEDVSIDGYN